MRRPACVDCMQTYNVEEIGITVLVQDEDLQPIEVWQADLWECRSCGNQIIGGFGNNAWSIKGDVDFEKHATEATKKGWVIR